ncbi:glycoside hydrolase family protein [Sphingomonas bacterium]|uniref:glycoside hydrolase family protein n=1 Tax=Sphingomonas bacterium TaxID=1895847 RepID=UPI0015750D05|nr:hypothetical protein [Sphingomonas bacterium]
MAIEQPPRPGAAASSRAPAIGGAIRLAAIGALVLSLATSGIKPDEGKANRTYLDIAKVPTYCYGHADRSAKVGTMRTDAQCDALLATDVRREQLGVAACVPGLRVRPYQWAASTRLAHNIGISGFCHSGAAIHFNRGDWRGGCDLFLPWDKARIGGQVVAVAGLAARRQRERAQCLTGLPA